MEIHIEKLKNGSYRPFDNKLFFKFNKQDILMTTYNVENGYNLVIDQKSALEITHTLLDSLNLLDKDAEELLYKIEDKITEE